MGNIRPDNNSRVVTRNNSKNNTIMKKIFISLLAVAALAACTKSGVEYTQTEEIGFAPYSITASKAAESTADYNDALPIYVYANAGTAETAPGDYNEAFLAKAEFANRTDLADNIFGGNPNPYYWPNVKKLVFAGYSKACNAASCTSRMNFTSNTLEIDGYVQAAGTATKGDNDLMWFPTTAPYGKGTAYVPVTMYHACSWITIKIGGDATTAKSGKEWKVKNITINGLTTKGNVKCVGQTAEWTLSTDGEDKNKTFVVFDGTQNLGEAATNVGFETIPDNTVVLPQTATDMDITYSYISQAGSEITETANVPLALDKSDSPAAEANDWKAGYHYIYTVTITASEILIQPVADPWTEYTPAIPGVEL